MSPDLDITQVIRFMSLWIDSQRPRTIHELQFNKDLCQKQTQYAERNDSSHLIFTGPEGSGRHTLAMMYTYYRCGLSSTDDLRGKRSVIAVKTPTKTLNITVYLSPYHIKIDPSTEGVHDRWVFQSYLDQIYRLQPKDPKFPMILIIDHAESLTEGAQQALRRSMEKYMGNIRMIFIVSHGSNLIPAITSRSLVIRVPAPSSDTIVGILHRLKDANHLDISDEVLNRIVARCQRNLTEAIDYLQYWSFRHSLPADPVLNIQWDEIILNGISIEALRNLVYPLLSEGVGVYTIMKQITFDLINCGDREGDVGIQALVKYGSLISVCTRDLYLLEGFLTFIQMKLAE